MNHQTQTIHLSQCVPLTYHTNYVYKNFMDVIHLICIIKTIQNVFTLSISLGLDNSFCFEAGINGRPFNINITLQTN